MMCNKPVIYIYKGDDTNWNDEQFLTINITSGAPNIDISTMTARFTLEKYVHDYELSTGSFQVDLAAAVTEDFPYGPAFGMVQILDAQGRVRTATTKIPFYVTSDPIGLQNQDIKIDIPGAVIDITVGGTVSYDNLSNKPAINGTVVEGYHSAAYYGLATSTDLSQKVSKSGDTMTGDLTLSDGASVKTANVKFHEVNENAVIGNPSNNYGLYVNPQGEGAAFVSSRGLKDVLTSDDLRNTYNPNSTYPITGQGVAAAVANKQDTITGAASTITQNNLTASTALVSDVNGKVAASNVTATELGYVSGVTGAIQTQIGNEVEARTNADLNLQGQIDAISASSDVTDIVGTYAELQAYDTSKLKDNDIIKVLTDSTHDNASSYYRWSTHTGTFTYVGSEGPYYTKSEADAEFLSQSSASTTYLTQSSAVSTYATQSSVTTGLASKASSADGVTIIDSGSAISTVAVKEQRANTAIKQWVGTKAQYDAITTKDPDTIYTVTDEDDTQPIVVDSELSPTSTNPIQNKAVYEALQNIDPLPSQTGESGKFLTTDGSSASWATVSAVPTQAWFSNQETTTLNTGLDLANAHLVKVYKNGLLLRETTETITDVFYATPSGQNNKYLDLGTIDFSQANSWEIKGSVKMTEVFTSSSYGGSIFNQKGSNTTYTCPTMGPGRNGTWGACATSNGSNWNIFNLSINAPSWQVGHYYNFSMDFTGTEYGVYIWEKNSIKTYVGGATNSAHVYGPSDLILLNGYVDQYNYSLNYGMICMSDFKITIDNEVMFDGATAVEGTDFINIGCTRSTETTQNGDYILSNQSVVFNDSLVETDNVCVEVY